MAEDLLGVNSGKSIDVNSFHVATSLIGGGRFASVYRAYDKRSMADVALKLYLTAGEHADLAAKAEKDTLKRLSDLNTPFFPAFKGLQRVRLKDGWHPVLVMELGEYVEGQPKRTGEAPDRSIISLAQVMPGARKNVSPMVDLPEFWRPEHLYNWITDLCGAVEALHSHGVVHRDLKPANILLKRMPGDEASRPFILDFNASVTPESAQASAIGTSNYLPPEVRSQKRSEPCVADDIWALALMIWETLFGFGRQPDCQATPHEWIVEPFPAGLVDVLLKALTFAPTQRYATAHEFHIALRATIAPTIASVSVEALSPDELMWMRECAATIRADMQRLFAGPDEIPVPKEIQDRVALLLSGLAQGETQSLDLESDISELGPPAISAVLTVIHKIRPDSNEFDQVARGVVVVARRDPTLAERCINAHFLSSDFGARRLCRRICEGLKIFPTVVLDSILDDEGVYLPEERVELADMCLDLSKDPEAILVLTKYMSREYLIDGNNFFALRDRIARRLGLLGFPQTAQHIVDEVSVHIGSDPKKR
jgi:serine/threonine protein kinase